MKKKLLTLGLSSTLAVSSILPAFANTIGNTDKTYIETAIGFKYPETIESLTKRNLKAILTGSASLELDLSQFLDSDNKSIQIDEYTITSEVIKENNKVNTIKFKIENLDASDGYKLQLTGKNYATSIIDLSTATYSKRINISTGTNMILGDVNSDNKINLEDRSLLEQNLNRTDSNLDINNDGKITAADIAIVNANMTDVIEPEIFDTEKVVSKIIENVNTSEITNNVDILPEDKIENLFVPGEKVSFKAKEGQENVSIPVSFEKTEELSSVQVNIPQGAESAIVTVLDENDNVLGKVDTKELVATYSRTGEKVVNVNLGARKPVKKIVIDVVPTEQGGYVVVEDIKLIGDIVNEEVVQDTVVKNVKATAGDEKVTLSWREVPNVTGYKVYYGTNMNNLNNVATTQDKTITISGLKNFNTYYFSVSATSNDWEGNKSTIVSATPEPEKLPNRPDFVTAKGEDRAISLSWKSAENAKSYNIYSKSEGESQFKKVAENIKSTNYKLTNLENNVEYTLYVTSQNDVGESGPSEQVNATPKKEIVDPPTLPTRDRIDNSSVVKVEMGHPHNFDSKLYPKGFDPNWLIDNDFSTDWVARQYYETNTFIFTFDTPKTMDYLIWAPRLDGEYKYSNRTYTITVWTEDDMQNGKTIVEGKEITQKFDGNKYYALTFPKTENIKKISVKLGERTGGPRVNASEVAFYEYNDISDRIDALFANNSKTAVTELATEEKINELRAEVSDLQGFILDRDMLLKELDIALSLVKGNKENLGVIKDDIYSINPQNDIKNHNKAINNWQPLGVAANAGDKVTIYADIPEDETVYLVPTQVFEEANKLSAEPIPLKNGRNVISIPKIGSNNSNRGGSLYVTYNGNNADKIKLQVVGGYKIPYLELNNFYNITEEEAKAKIDAYITELTNYKPVTNEGNKQWQTTNITEISLPNVLLSLPANKVLEGINKNTTTQEEKVEKMYQNVLAWEQLLDVVYKTYGIDEPKNALETRNNIRFMKMFAGAFMYAAGNHIGIGYDSVAPLMNGKPVGEDTLTENNLFGWGIAHEIGHVMDALGKPEVTNNIYSLMAQTYDGKTNILPSRLEKNGCYDKAFNKVAIGGEGVPNDVFVHLVMYWQLHLAYDNGENPFGFYNNIHKLYRTDSSLNSFKDMDKFAVASSKVAKKDLTEFFTRWGVSLSEQAKQVMNQQGEDEARAIYYLNDESRRKRLENNQGNTNIEANATLNVQPSDSSSNNKAKEVVINITSNSQNVQGYEILRKGSGDSTFKAIGFTTNGVYKDYIGSANNMTFTYAIKPVDILGNVNKQKEIGQVRISYDNTIENNEYELNEDTGIVTFKQPTIVTGIKVTPKNPETPMPSGAYKVYANIVSDVAPASVDENYILAKDGKFETGNFATQNNTYISYFGKSGSTEDKIFAYDVNSLKLEGFDFKNYNVEFISYPGDNVEFLEMGVGRLAEDYVYDSVDNEGNPIKETVPANTLVIMGKYRGNSAISNIYIKGKYAKESSLNEDLKTEERLVEGYTLMFDTVDADGTITSSTAEGIFMFVPKIQEDNQGEELEKHSILPTEIMAEMWQGPYKQPSSRITSDTMWINMPSDKSLPKIKITTDKENAPKIKMITDK